jgi:hypothetical protein
MAAQTKEAPEAKSWFSSGKGGFGPAGFSPRHGAGHGRIPRQLLLQVTPCGIVSRGCRGGQHISSYMHIYAYCLTGALLLCPSPVRRSRWRWTPTGRICGRANSRMSQIGEGELHEFAATLARCMTKITYAPDLSPACVFAVTKTRFASCFNMLSPTFYSFWISGLEIRR